MAKSEKWRLIEGVVEALERGGAPEGAVITRNAAVPYRTEPSRKRQVDVHVAVPAGPRTFTAGIEVKDEKAPLSVEVVEQIEAKLSKLQLDRRCLVSRSGFSKGGQRDAVPGGLELLTLEQLGSVSWWWGSMTMPMLRSQIEIVRVRVDYDAATRAKLASALHELSVVKCEIVDSGGNSATLHRFGIHQGLTALREPAAQSLEDGSCFEVQVEPPPGTWTALRNGEEELPPPARIVYGLRLHQCWEETPLEAFALHDRQALSTSFPFIDGEEFQLTFVGKEGELPGSIGDLKMVVGPVKVPKKKV